MTGEPDAHKRRVAGVFDRAAARYDRVGTPLFAPLGQRLVELAGIAPGARVLDVATGTGAVLVPAAHAAGGSGYVLGVDLAPEMVAAAAANAPPGGARVETRVMDAEHLDDLPDASFDAVLCGCAVSFLPDPVRAVAGFGRVVRPGGTVAISRWAEADPRWGWYAELLQRVGMEPRRLMVGSPDAASLLAGAGLSEVAVTAEPFELRFRDPGEWWQWLWSMPYRAALEELPADVRERLRAAAFQRVEAMRDRDGGVGLRAEAHYAVAARPAGR